MTRPPAIDVSWPAMLALLNRVCAAPEPERIELIVAGLVVRVYPERVANPFERKKRLASLVLSVSRMDGSASVTVTETYRGSRITVGNATLPGEVVGLREGPPSLTVGSADFDLRRIVL